MIHHSTTAVIAILCSCVAMAETATPSDQTTPLKASLFGNVKGKTTFVDSTRTDLPDFNIDDLNLGVNASHGIGFGRFKLNINPNGVLTVKEAHAYLEYLDTNIGFGRFDTGIYDANRAVDDTRRMDALRAGYTLKLAATRSLAIKSYYGRTFEGSANYRETARATQWRAYGATVDATFDGYILNLRYGIEPNRLAASTTTTTTELTTLSTSPWSSIKIEGGYDRGTISTKAFVVTSSLDKAKMVEEAEGVHQYKTRGGEFGSKSQFTMAGLDLSGNSELWGLKGIAMPEDKLTYGLTVANSTQKIAAQESSDNKINLRGGYSTGSMGATLEFETHFADEKIWKESNGDPSKRKHSLVLSLDMGF